MLRLLAPIAMCALVLTLSACTYFSNPPIIQGRDKAYLNARTTPPLRVPPGYSSAKIKNEYPIPNNQYPTSATTISTIPPGLKSS